MTERGETIVHQAIAIMVPALAPIVPRAPVPIMIAGALALAALLVIRHRRPATLDWVVWTGALALVAWAALSTVWSIEPAWRGLAMLGGIFACGLLLISCANDHQPDAIGRALVIGMVLGLVLYAFEAISDNWLTRFVRGFTWPTILDDRTGGISTQSYLINGTAIFSLLIWPVVSLLVQSGRRLLAISSVIVVILLVADFGSDAGLVAVALGALMWEFSARLGARAARLTAIVFAAMVLVTPLVAHRVLATTDLQQLGAQNSHVPSSALIRLFIWRFAAERIAERPLLGWGFDSARRIPGGSDAIQARASDGRLVVNDINMPLHPHNQSLQIWLELGAVGALIVAIVGAWIIWRIGARAPPFRNGALALVTTVLVYDFVSFGAWQSWWLAAVFVAAMLQATVCAQTPPPQPDLAIHTNPPEGPRIRK